jgi:hypothetical protein
MGSITDHASLFDFARLFGGTVDLMWFVWVALAFIIIGALLGLIGSLITGKNGKNLLAGGGILVILSPVIFTVGWVTSIINTTLPLFYSAGGVTAFASFGFFLALIAGIIMLISTRKHPMAAEGPTVSSPPPPMQ